MKKIYSFLFVLIPAAPIMTALVMQTSRNRSGNNITFNNCIEKNEDK
jgi:hypothetical protein